MGRRELRRQRDLDAGKRPRRGAIGLLAGVVLLGTALLAAAEDSQPQPQASQSNARIGQLIEQLGDRDYFVRQRAEDELAKYSFEAFDALTAATTHADLEIAARAKHLLQVMRTRWVTPSDPPEVQKLLEDYESLDRQTKITRMHALAGLPEWQGIAALCRLIRYQYSPVLRKYGAIELLGVPLPGRLLSLDEWADEPGDRPPDAKLAALVREHLGSDSQPSARWVLTYVKFVEDPAATVAQWTKLIDAEQALLRRTADQSGTEIVAALIRRQMLWFKQLDQRDNLVASIRRLIDLEKDEPVALSRLLISLVRQKEYAVVDQALADPLVKRFSGNPLLLYDVAAALADQGQADLSQRVALLAWKLNPTENPTSLTRHYAIARALQERGLFPWAKREYRHVIETGTSGGRLVVEAQYIFAEMLHDQQEDLEAAEVLKSLIASLEKLPNPADVLGVGLASTRSRMNYFLACHWAAANEPAKQLEYLDTALAADPSDIDVLIACFHLPDRPAEFREKIVGLIKKAADGLRKQIADEPDSPVGYNQFAWLIGNTEGDLDEAVRFSQKSIELSPDSGGYYDTLAHVYFTKGDYENAVKTQTKAAELDPHSGLIARPLETFRKKWEEQKAQANAAGGSRQDAITTRGSKNHEDATGRRNRIGAGRPWDRAAGRAGPRLPAGSLDVERPDRVAVAAASRDRARPARLRTQPHVGRRVWPGRDGDDGAIRRRSGRVVGCVGRGRARGALRAVDGRIHRAAVRPQTPFATEPADSLRHQVGRRHARDRRRAAHHGGARARGGAGSAGRGDDAPLVRPRDGKGSPGGGRVAAPRDDGQRPAGDRRGGVGDGRAARRDRVVAGDRLSDAGDRRRVGCVFPARGNAGRCRSDPRGAIRRDRRLGPHDDHRRARAVQRRHRAISASRES